MASLTNKSDYNFSRTDCENKKTAASLYYGHISWLTSTDMNENIVLFIATLVFFFCTT